MSLHWKAVNGWLASLFGLVVALGTAAEIALNVYGIPSRNDLVRMFNLSYESNIPTLYSGFLLFACALLLASIWRLSRERGDAYQWHWLALAIIFTYLSVDEAIMIHENFNGPLCRALGLGGVFYFAWVIPFGAGLLALGCAYCKFLLALPLQFRLLFICAGAVYVGGALGTELPISAWYQLNGGSNLTYGLLNLLQESMEILGATIFCSALFGYLGFRFGSVEISFRRQEAGPIPPACGQRTI